MEVVGGNERISWTYTPRRIQFQWHVTERCNRRCTHCYQDGHPTDELCFEDLLRILAQFQQLLARWRDLAKPNHIPGHVTVTGGEPFVRDDFVDLLSVLSSHRPEFSFAILTNGSLIDRAMARRLRDLGPAYVQVSMEGGRETHERIRGRGSHGEAVRAVEQLVGAGVRTFISFTAHRGNFREFGEVARLGQELRVTRVWADRLIPWGRGAEIADQTLTPEETRELFEIMQDARKAAHGWRSGGTEISMHRALQFLVAGGEPYHCAAGDSLVTVLPNGDLYPCRRMPIRVGNLMDTPLGHLYYRSEILRALRDSARVAEGCAACFYRRLCGGGSRCLSYAVAGNPFEADPGCWLAAKKDWGEIQPRCKASTADPERLAQAAT